MNFDGFNVISQSEWSERIYRSSRGDIGAKEVMLILSRVLT